MAEKKSDVPDDRCGYTRFNDVEGSDLRDVFVKKIEPVCCWRPIWESPDEADRCIWHADVDEKPLAELITARADFPERLNWAILRNLHVESDELSLSGCTLLGATFDKSRLEEINLIDTDLRDATFTDAALPKADFAGANLQGVDFTEAFLQDVDFTNADLWNADFADAHLVGADFADAQLQYANFTGAQLAVADFTDTALPKTDFTDTYLYKVDFTDADLQNAELSDADAREASFHHANLQDAVFTRTDCREAIFTSALLYETVFSDTRINSTTTYFDPETTFYNSITSRPGCVYEESPCTAEQLPDDVQPLEAARWVYRRLETLHEENALSEDAREFHISKEEAERALYRERGEYGPWGVKTLMWYLTRHGESVKRVLTWWGGVILTAGILCSIGGGVTDSEGDPYAITSPGELATIAGWQDILWNIYFSITTFSTIMDGGLAPAGNGTRAVVAVESITGALLVALLVFVLGRRVAR